MFSEPTGIVPLRFDHDGKPPPKLEIGLGQLHSLPCSAWTVYPPLTITWTKDDIILQRIHSPSSTASNHLTISRTDKSDSGSYFCEVQDRTNVTLLAETRVTVMGESCSVEELSFVYSWCVYRSTCCADCT